MLRRPGGESTPFVDDVPGSEPLTRVEEADRLLAALSEHQEHELPEARSQLEEALRLDGEIDTTPNLQPTAMIFVGHQRELAGCHSHGPVFGNEP
jgi:hypothetical protein